MPSMALSLQGFVKMSFRDEFRPPSSSSYLLSLLIIFHFNPVATTIVPTLLWNLCPTDANYTANSTFHTNLNLLFSALSSSSTAATGFLNDTIGQSPNQVFGLALCRGDLSLSDCQGCLNTSVTQITQSCPTGMSSAIWYDICMLRYSNTNFFSTDRISYKVWETNVNNASDQQIFNDKLGNLMNSLATKARSSSKLFAAGNVNATSFMTIYGLVQCTRDLYAVECYNCLLDAVGSIPTYCGWKQGCKVLQLSCNIRYEIYPFYNMSYATEVTFTPGNEVTTTGPVFIQNMCPTDASSTANSGYHTNLKLLLSSLSSSTAGAGGFYNDTIGRPPDQVYGLALCQGDLSPSACQGCLNASVTQITQSCPTGMSSTIWYDICMLRYSSINFFSTADNSIEFSQISSNIAFASNPQLLKFQLRSLMSSLATKAARSSSKMFAAGDGNLTSITKIYGMVQCTRDLSADNCYNCLVDAAETIANLSSGSQGCKVLRQSCRVQYEIYPLSDISATDVASPLPLTANLPPYYVHGRKSNSTGRRILFSVISIAAALPCICAIFIYCGRTKSPLRRRQLVETFNHNDQNEIRAADSLLFDLETIRIATGNFSDRNKLGQGGFGPVYKGTLGNGERVAVKRLSRSSGQGLDELKNEVFLVAKLRHRNLVRLLGCCLESEEKLLVYNYLPNTSLDKFLFDNSKREQLDWARRFKIIEGIGRGLLYLHEDSPLKIIHRDLKASNILLDANMNPKISDFGLAKLFGGDETQGNTNRIAGTLGYMAPEYALHGLFSVKSDVYSYGVLILEIIIGQRNNGYRGSEYPIELVTHVVWRHWTQGSALQVIDQGLVEQCQAQQILRCIQIGLLCVQEDPIRRPTMANVVLMLNSHFVGLPTPSAPAFLSNRNITSESNGVPSRENSNGSKGILMKISENNVSISELEPR